MGYVKDGEKRYYLEVIAALALFMVANWLRHTVSHDTTSPGLLLAMQLFPLLPILLIAVAVWRLYRRCDELQRQTLLKTCAAASLLSMFILLAWPVLRVVGIPQPTGKSAIFTICGCYFLCGAVIQFRGARAEGGAKQGFIRLVPMLSLLVCMLALVLGLDHFLPAQLTPTLRGMTGLGGTIIIILIYWQLKRRLDS